MASELYNETAYRQFADNIMPLLKGKNIEHPSMGKLRSLATKTAVRTKFGSWAWRSAVSSRIGPRTVYLGSPSVRLPKLTDVMRTLVENAPEELHKITQVMRDLPFVHIRRQMGNNP